MMLQVDLIGFSGVVNINNRINPTFHSLRSGTKKKKGLTIAMENVNEMGKFMIFCK